MSKALYSLMQQSVLVTSTLALLVVGTACYIWASGHVVPQEMYVILSLIVGFFFGSKSERKMGDTLMESQNARTKNP